MTYTGIAREQMILKNQNLIYYVLKKLNLYQKHEEYFDLGMIGLIKGVDTYNAEKGQPSTYLCRCIQNSILMYLRKKRLQTISFEEKITDDFILEDVLSSNDNFTHEIEQIDILKRGLKVLTEKEKDILIKNYGLFGSKVYNQKELAMMYNHTQSYISRIIQNAIKKIKEVV